MAEGQLEIQAPPSQERDREMLWPACGPVGGVQLPSARRGLSL